MHLWRTWLGLWVLAAFAGQAAVVYKWKDADGVVHYSDQPVPGAEKVTTSANSMNLSTGGSSNPAPQTPAAQRPPARGLGYDILSISSPTPDQTFFGDDLINVALALDPGLQSNHAIVWHLNGTPLGDQGPASTQFALAHLDRGTYSLDATITDQQSGESQTTPSVTFYVRQPSALSPLHKTP